MSETLFNRKQMLKEYKPMEPIQLPSQQIQYYVQKIRDICDNEGCDSLPTSYLIELEANQDPIDADYVKYLALKHVDEIIRYIKSKGVVLIDIEWNIKLILNEIINDVVDEDYYLNTLDIYDSLNGNKIDDYNIYDIINQAIRLDNKRMLYYIIFKEDEEMADRVYEVIGE